MLPSLLPLPHLWNFLLPLPASDRLSRFRFQYLSSRCFRFHKNLTASTASSFRISVCNSCDWQSTRFYKLRVILLGLRGSATCQHVQQPQQTKKEPIITTSWPLLATLKPPTLMPWQYWWYITYITSHTRSLAKTVCLWLFINYDNLRQHKP